MTGDYANAGYDEFVAAVAEGEAYYLECANGHGELPPRRVCPECGSTEFTEEPLPAAGEVRTYTVTHVAAPSFADDAPYVTAIADFGPVRITAQLRGIDPDDVETGMSVGLGVETTETTGADLLVVRPR
ncbi:nucleic acid-binding protein [Halobacteriales archaeon QS_8_69_26]|nr:MAG: nucleic acid-binding protein [Halobacteriales archaeon QS_8_69_26]